ncbi:MAG: DUF4416 family protein [Nitrospirae bacterium]|nr:DUF4416 family protein [Nitrospirota bacterium]
MISHIADPKPVKLFIGMLSPEISLFDELKEKLKDIFGAIDLESPVREWGHTDYYSKEMGADLKRKFIFFEKLISPEAISEIKLKTNELERQYLNENNPPSSPFSKGGIRKSFSYSPPLAKSDRLDTEGGRGDLKEGSKGGFEAGVDGFNGGRRINLDPGYLDSAKVVLVSTKDFSHRIYLGRGIYGEVTLVYSGKNYQTFPYTYPDFRTQEYFDIFKKARDMYKNQSTRI